MGPLFSMQELGTHAIVDAWGADPEGLSDAERLEGSLREAVLTAGARIIGSGSYGFHPRGATAWVVAAEGHATLRTFPDEGRWTADVFFEAVCEDVEPEDVVDVLLEAVGGDARVSHLSRG